MKDNNALSWVCSAVTTVTSFAFEDFVRIILLVLGVISALVSLAYNIYSWYHKAKADGKIDSEEIEELGHIIDSGTKTIDEVTHKKGDK